MACWPAIKFDSVVSGSSKLIQLGIRRSVPLAMPPDFIWIDWMSARKPTIRRVAMAATRRFRVQVSSTECQHPRDRVFVYFTDVIRVTSRLWAKSKLPTRVVTTRSAPQRARVCSRGLPQSCFPETHRRHSAEEHSEHPEAKEKCTTECGRSKQVRVARDTLFGNTCAITELHVPCTPYSVGKPRSFTCKDRGTSRRGGWSWRFSRRGGETSACRG